MADFNIAFKKVTGVEGGKLTNDPDDSGGETFCEISRVYNPDWEGWPIIDGLRDSPDFPDCLSTNDSLNAARKNFLKRNYWDIFRGDAILHQGLANNLYDISINIGQATCIIWLQIALTVMNRTDPVAFYPDLKRDGQMGNRTFAALQKFVAVEKENSSRIDPDPYDTLNHMLNDRQSVHYQDKGFSVPSQRKYTRGHLKRTRYDD